MAETFSLSLPDYPDVQRLLQEYRKLEAVAAAQREMLNRSIHGLLVDEPFHDLITTVYPHDASPVMSSADKFVAAGLDRALYEITRVCEMRRDTAVSGAMRWPWSQEAKLGQLNDEFRFV